MTMVTYINNEFRKLNRAGIANLSELAQFRGVFIL